MQDMTLEKLENIILSGDSLSPFIHSEVVDKEVVVLMGKPASGKSTMVIRGRENDYRLIQSTIGVATELVEVPILGYLQISTSDNLIGQTKELIKRIYPLNTMEVGGQNWMGKDDISLRQRQEAYRESRGCAMFVSIEELIEGPSSIRWEDAVNTCLSMAKEYTSTAKVRVGGDKFCFWAVITKLDADPNLLKDLAPDRYGYPTGGDISVNNREKVVNFMKDGKNISNYLGFITELTNKLNTFYPGSRIRGAITSSKYDVISKNNKDTISLLFMDMIDALRKKEEIIAKAAVKSADYSAIINMDDFF